MHAPLHLSGCVWSACANTRIENDSCVGFVMVEVDCGNGIAMQPYDDFGISDIYRSVNGFKVVKVSDSVAYLFVDASV